MIVFGCGASTRCPRGPGVCPPTYLGCPVERERKSVAASYGSKRAPAYQTDELAQHLNSWSCWLGGWPTRSPTVPPAPMQNRIIIACD
jgi:hypothetical protein